MDDFAGPVVTQSPIRSFSPAFTSLPLAFRGSGSSKPLRGKSMGDFDVRLVQRNSESWYASTFRAKECTIATCQDLYKFVEPYCNVNVKNG